MDHWLDYLCWELGVNIEEQHPLESNPWVDIGGEG